MTEKELIQGCIKQDRRCQNGLYKLYFPLMSSIALRYSNNEEEALQHINYGFLKVLNSIKSYNPEYALATWIRNILIHHIIDENRRNRKYSAMVNVTYELREEHVSDSNLGEQKMEAADMLEMLKKLPEGNRKVFTLFAIDGYKHSEISQMMGISEGTSKWHVNEARKKLYEMLEQEKKTVIDNKISA